jgi:hypothetical protein
MKILTIRRIVSLAAIGVAYVHGKRGGDLTLTSIADTLNYLWSSASDRIGLAGPAQRSTRDRPVSPSAAPSTAAANGLTDDRTRRPYNG